MTVNRLIIHVGRQKTGTTALQQALHQSKTLLLSKGLLYPETGRRTEERLLIAHHPLADAVRRTPELARALYLEILAEGNRWGCHTLILSSESFLNLNPSDLADLLGSSSTSLEIEVIVYLRNPFLFSVSSYAQRLQASHYPEDLTTWVLTHSGKLAAVIENWSRVFPNICWCYYQREKLLNQNIVDDFLHVANLDMSLESLALSAPSTKQANPTISGNLVWIKRRLNEVCLMRGDSDNHYGLFSELAEEEHFRGQGLLLDPWVKKALIQNLRHDMEAIAISSSVAGAPSTELMMREARTTQSRPMDYGLLLEDLDWLRQHPKAGRLMSFLL